MRWSDPFDSLSVGERFTSQARIVRDTDVLVFSALTGDWHPQHCDPEWAARSVFGERIAHGMLVLSLAVGLAPLDPTRVMALRGLSGVVFKRPVRLGDAIHVEAELVALKPLDGVAGLVDVRWTIRNQDQQTVCRSTLQLLWSREQGEGAGGEPTEEVAGALQRGAELGRC